MNRFMVTLKAVAGASEGMIEAGRLLAAMQKLKNVVDVVPLRENEIVGDVKEFYAGLNTEAHNQLIQRQSELTSYREDIARLIFALEESLGFLSELAVASDSKTLRKFVKRTRKILEAPKPSQTPP